MGFSMGAECILTGCVPRPVRTFDTAAVYYHKFRLLHSDGEYSYTVCLFAIP